MKLNEIYVVNDEPGCASALEFILIAIDEKKDITPSTMWKISRLAARGFMLPSMNILSPIGKDLGLWKQDGRNKPLYLTPVGKEIAQKARVRIEAEQPFDFAAWQVREKARKGREEAAKTNEIPKAGEMIYLRKRTYIGPWSNIKINGVDVPLILLDKWAYNKSQWKKKLTPFMVTGLHVAESKTYVMIMVGQQLHAVSLDAIQRRRPAGQGLNGRKKAKK